MSYLNSNGLIDGYIPKGKACPFLERCGLRTDNCPTAAKPKPGPFSCGGARAISLTFDLYDRHGKPYDETGKEL